MMIIYLCLEEDKYIHCPKPPIVYVYIFQNERNNALSICSRKFW